MNRKQLETKLREQEKALANLNEILEADKRVTSFEERTDKTRTHIKRGETTLTKAELEEKRNKMEKEKQKLEATIDHLRRQVDRKLIVELTRIDQQNRWRVARRKTTTPTYTEFPEVFSDSDENKLVIDDKPRRKRKRTKKTRGRRQTQTTTEESPSQTVTNSSTAQSENEDTTTESTTTPKSNATKQDEDDQTVEVIPQMKLPLKKRKLESNQMENTSVITVEDDETNSEQSPSNQEHEEEKTIPQQQEITNEQTEQEEPQEKPFEIVKKKGEDDKNVITIRVKKRKVKQISIKTEKITESHQDASNQKEQDKEPETSEVGYIEIKPNTPQATEQDQHNKENQTPNRPQNTDSPQRDQELDEANPPPTISPTPMEVTNPAQQTENNPPAWTTPNATFWRPHETERPIRNWTPNPAQTANIHNQIEAIRRRQEAQNRQAHRPNTLPLPNIPITQNHQVTTPVAPPQTHPPQISTAAAEYILNNIQNPASIATSQTKTGKPRGRPPTRGIRPMNTVTAAIRPQPIRAGHIMAAGREIPITHHHQTGNPTQANFVTHNPVAQMQNQRNAAIQRLISHQRNGNLPTPRPYNLHHGNHRLPFNNNMQVGAPLESSVYPTNNPPRSLPTPMSPSIYARQTLPIPPIFLPANTYWIIRAARTGTNNDMTQVFLWPLYGYNAFENPLATTGTRNGNHHGYPAAPNQ